MFNSTRSSITSIQSQRGNSVITNSSKAVDHTKLNSTNRRVVNNVARYRRENGISPSQYYVYRNYMAQQQMLPKPLTTISNAVISNRLNSYARGIGFPIFVSSFQNQMGGIIYAAPLELNPEKIKGSKRY